MSVHTGKTTVIPGKDSDLVIREVPVNIPANMSIPTQKSVQVVPHPHVSQAPGADGRRIVNVPINMALEKEAVLADKVKNSLAYKIEDLDGQIARKWFKNDFGAKNQIELQPKLKSSTGLFKGKLIVDPSDHSHINIFEEIELQTKFGQYDTSFKVKPTEIIAQFDLGPRSVESNWFNPYFGFKIPKSTSGNCWLKSATLGGIFHYAPSPLTYWIKYMTDLTVTPSSDPLKRSAVEIRQNFATFYKNYVFSVLETWALASGPQGTSRSAKLSLGYVDPKYDGYVQTDVKDSFCVSQITVGGSYKLNQDLRLYSQISQVISSKPEKIDIGVGVDFSQPLRGIGVKLGYFHEKKIATVLTFGLNRYFTGSILFDVDLGLTFRSLSVPPLPSKTSPTELP